MELSRLGEGIVKLPNLQISSIDVPEIPGLFQINPAVCFENELIVYYYRATSWGFFPKCNMRGHYFLQTTDPRSKLTEVNSRSIVRNALFKFGENGVIPEVILSERVPPSFEDPRYIGSQDYQLLVGTVTDADIARPPDGLIQSAGILDLKSGCIRRLESPFGLNCEKNWVPIEIRDSKLYLLYSNSPTSIVEYDLISSTQNISMISRGDFISTHGGSPFVRIDNETFLRISRIKVPIQKYGLVHFSFFSLHDSNYKEIFMSRPFVLNTIGFEVCNGLLLDVKEDNFILSWGENDRRMLKGVVNRELLLEWIYLNPITKERKNAVSWISVFRSIYLDMK